MRLPSNIFKILYVYAAGGLPGLLFHAPLIAMDSSATLTTSNRSQLQGSSSAMEKHSYTTAVQVRSRSERPKTVALQKFRNSSSSPGNPPIYQIYDKAGNPSALENIIQSSGAHQIVLWGELHDDPVTHWLRLRVLRGLAGSKRRVVLAGEMFEAHQQSILDDFMYSKRPWQSLGKDLELWPNFKTDYLPMVNFAREGGIPLVATNLPRPMAREIARRGLEGYLQSIGISVELNETGMEKRTPVTEFRNRGSKEGDLDLAMDSSASLTTGSSASLTTRNRSAGRATDLPGADPKSLVAHSDLQFMAPLPISIDETLPGYAAMLKMFGPPTASGKSKTGDEKKDNHSRNHGHGHLNARYLVQTQAVKDATMAYFIEKSIRPNTTLLHANGRYHSDNFEGIVWYLQRATPAAKILTVTTVRAGDVTRFDESWQNLADFVIVVADDFARSY